MTQQTHAATDTQSPTHDNNHILSEPYRFQSQHTTQQQSIPGYYRSNSYMTEYQPVKWLKR